MKIPQVWFRLEKGRLESVMFNATRKAIADKLFSRGAIQVHEKARSTIGIFRDDIGIVSVIKYFW